MPEISIIIPCHNVENYIDRCFNSLKAQTIGLDKLQLIFVDDASTDGTRDKLSFIEQQAPDSVCVVLLPQNLRQGGARNIGLEYATGTYIGFVDADDWVEPDMFERLYDGICTDNCDLAFCRHIRDNGKGALFLDDEKKSTAKKDRTLFVLSDEQRTDFIVSSLIGYGVWDKLYRKDFLIDHQISFPEHLTYEDIYFGSLVYLYAKRVRMVERRLYHYYINDSSTVLGRNQVHHKDIFKINQLKWETYQERGFLQKYRKALEFDFIMTNYMAGFKILALRFDEIPYEDFLQLKKGTLERVPDFEKNAYCHSHITEIYKILLQLLKHPISPEELLQIQQAFKAYHKLT